MNSKTPSINRLNTYRMLSTKMLSKSDKNKDLEKVSFIRSFNFSHVINLSKFTRSMENIRSNELRQCFQNKTVRLATRQPKY